LGNSNIEISIEKKKTSANHTTDRKIVEIGNDEYDQMIALWECSIRATHHFVLEKDIDFYKQLIHKNLGKVKLYAIKDNKMLAFMGTS
jgi:putative acetyltransferase